MAQKRVGYSGWLGKNNIGDEAVYAATAELFPDYQFVPRKYLPDEVAVIYGGGTVLPPKVSLEKYPPKDVFAAAIGVGIKDPRFRNTKRAKIDLGYYLGRANIDDVLTNSGIQYILKPIEHYIDHISVDNHFYHEEKYKNLKFFDYMGVRGPISNEILGKYGISCQVVGDTALILEPTKYIDTETNRIIVSLRTYGSKLGSTTTNKENYLDEIVEFCRLLEDEYTFVFVPLHPRDIKQHIKLNNTIENSEFHDYCSNVDLSGVINEFSKGDFVIGERLHASVFSACVHTPFLSIGYRPKNEDFARSIQMGEYNIPINEFSKEKLHSAFETSIHSTKTKKRIKAEVEQKRSKLTGFADEIERDLDSLVV